jgi:hypothetical protein
MLGSDSSVLLSLFCGLHDLFFVCFVKKKKKKKKEKSKEKNKMGGLLQGFF